MYINQVIIYNFFPIIDVVSFVAVLVSNGTDLPNNPIPKTNKTKEQVVDVTNTTQSTSGTIIKVSVQCGVVVVLGAYNNSQPSLASYHYIASATDMKPGKLYLVKQASPSTFFLTIISKKRFDLQTSACNNPCYNVSLNATDPSIKVTCRQNNKEILCSTEDLKNVLDKNIKYPCTKENRQKGLYIFPYPNQPEKYLQCDSAGKLTIVLCPKNQSFDATSKTCKLSPVTLPLPGIALRKNPCIIFYPIYYRPHPEDLSKFIQCRRGKSLEVTCPATLYWHPGIWGCVFNPFSNVCGANTKGMLQPHPFSNSYFIACGKCKDYQIRKCKTNKNWNSTLSDCV
ncbi:uncharacterized protein LOC106870155 [Octopus bimaculoides]|nr:uncharacterized protein LOC106870155 [Octopus bimaculoides]|eukprot:XP_014771641.1 PREDICTED: uncharacterized protein LOC106870155 [Octopus bimaculoides]